MKRKIKVILAIVTSLDGKTTKGEIVNQYKWASREDQEHFFSLIASNNLIVMGRKTYEASKPIIKLEKGKQRIVLTKTPEKFKKDEVEGQLQFSSESVQPLLKRLEKAGYKKLLLVGGSSANSLFFKNKLIDEIWITVEPRIFGTGNGLVDEVGFDVQLSLISVQKLNKNGTLLLKYKVKQPQREQE
jgi:dihydrofolate reductase